MEAKKSLGQHFLHDEGVIIKIVKEVKNANHIVEIGGGQGALTEKLVELGIPLTVIEIDRRLFELLKDKFSNYDVNIIHGDASLFKLDTLSTVVGNLPYNVSKRIIKNMVLQKDKVEKMVFMVQKEVADSIVAKVGSREYSKFSILNQLFFDVKKLFNVKSGAFSPPPKVDSSVVRFEPYETNLLGADIKDKFFEFLNILFLHPRKTVKNNIKSILKKNKKTEDLLVKRPQNLTLHEIYKIYLGCSYE